MPVLDRICKEENVELAKVNVDQHSEIAEQLGVSGIPAVFFASNGKIV